MVPVQPNVTIVTVKQFRGRTANTILVSGMLNLIPQRVHVETVIIQLDHEPRSAVQNPEYRGEYTNEHWISNPRRAG